MLFGNDEPQPAYVLKCPQCGNTEKISGRTTQWALIRSCGNCGNQWDGGVVARPDPGEGPPPPPGVSAHEDLPDIDYSPNFRRGGRDE